MPRHLLKLATLVVAVLTVYGYAGANHAATAIAEPSSLSADALILSADEVRSIADFFDMNPVPVLDVRAPTVDHGRDFQFPAQCRADFDQDVTYAPGWTQFRSVTYSGPANKAVIQSIGIYPDSGAALQALSQLGDQLSACSDLHSPAFPFETHRQDSSTVAWCFGDGCPILYHVKSSALIGVKVAHFPPTAGRTAAQLLQTISDRINIA